MRGEELLEARRGQLPDAAAVHVTWHARRGSVAIPVTRAGSHWKRRLGFTIGGAMGYLELFAQRTFAEETERITEGAARWQDPPEIRLEKVTSDGFLVIRQPHLLEYLASPWPLAQPHGEVMLYTLGRRPLRTG